jgi:hypothetical protein
MPPGKGYDDGTWFRPKGDPYRYKVEGDTIQFEAVEPTQAHGQGETGQVSKSHVINQKPQWAERNLGVDLSKRTASNPDGPNTKNTTPSADTTQADTTRTDTTQGSSQANTGDQGVLELIQQVAPDRPDSAAQSPPNARTQSAVGAVRGPQQSTADESSGFMRGLGIAARNLLEGGASGLGVVGDPVNALLNPLSEGFMDPDVAAGSTRRGMETVLDMAGLPEAETTTEQVGAAVNRLGGEALLGGAVTKAGTAGRTATRLGQSSSTFKQLLQTAMGGGAGDDLTTAQKLAQQRKGPVDESDALQQWPRQRTRANPKSPAGKDLNVQSSTASDNVGAAVDDTGPIPPSAQQETMEEAAAVRKGGGWYDVRRPDGSVETVQGIDNVPDDVPVVNKGGTSQIPGEARSSVPRSVQGQRTTPSSRQGVPQSSGRVTPGGQMTPAGSVPDPDSFIEQLNAVRRGTDIPTQSSVPPPLRSGSGQSAIPRDMDTEDVLDLIEMIRRNRASTTQATRPGTSVLTQ